MTLLGVYLAFTILFFIASIFVLREYEKSEECYMGFKVSWAVIILASFLWPYWTVKNITLGIKNGWKSWN